jgi:hypothetical protein
LYRYAAEVADVEHDMEWLTGGDLPGVYGRRLKFAEGSLYTFVSEFGWNAEVKVKDAASGAVYSFTLESDRSVLFATDRQGRVTAVYRPEEVSIKTEGLA